MYNSIYVHVHVGGRGVAHAHYYKVTYRIQNEYSSDARAGSGIYRYGGVTVNYYAAAAAQAQAEDTNR